MFEYSTKIVIQLNILPLTHNNCYQTGLFKIISLWVKNYCFMIYIKSVVAVLKIGGGESVRIAHNIKNILIKNQREKVYFKSPFKSYE